MGFKILKSKYFIVREDYIDELCAYCSKRVKKELTEDEIKELREVFK